MSATVEHEHLDVLTNTEASELVSIRGVANLLVHPRGMDLQLRGGGIVAFYTSGLWKGCFRFEDGTV